ncbi:MAG TPA: hypothetical protein VIK92_08135 [Thermaerobacter sp.]
MRVHLRLAREGLILAAVMGLLGALLLHRAESIIGYPPWTHTLHRLAEEFLVLAVLPVAAQLWSDVEGRRPALWRALPFSRGEAVLLRLLLPVAVYAAVTVPVLLDGRRLVVDPPAPVAAMVLHGLPVAALLSGLTAVLAVLARMPVAGAAGALAWWAVESLTRGDLTGPLYLFAASGSEPGTVHLGMNRAVLGLLAAAAGCVTWAYFRQNERFLRD